jgi:hypothetical protein
MNEPILFQHPVQTGSCSGPQVPLWEPTGNFPTIGELQRLTIDLKPLASRLWRAFAGGLRVGVGAELHAEKRRSGRKK